MNWIADLPFGRGRHFGTNHARPMLDAVHRRLDDGRHLPADQRVPVHRHQLPSVLVDELEPAGQRRAGRRRACCRRRARRKDVDRRLSEPVQRSDRPRSTSSGAPARVKWACATCCDGDGYFSIDFSLSKGWTMPWTKNHKLRFRWDTFNLTNTPKFDVHFLDVYPDRAASSAGTTTPSRPATAAPGGACSSRCATSSRSWLGPQVARRRGFNPSTAQPGHRVTAVAELVRAERLDRINPRRACRRPRDRDQRDNDHDGRRDREDPRIARVRSGQQAAHHAAQRGSADRADHDADAHQRQPLTEKQSKHFPSAGAERHADADLPRPLRDQVGEHAV